MLITKLELHKYKRMLLNNIQKITYTPQTKIQLILGTNGSGKSSLLKELSPLPATPNEYTSGGYKLIEITHNNNSYILKSNIGHGNRFSFIKNNEELNPGGTVTVYKELVKQEFNITQDIQDVMLGISNFHSMTVNERRAWFTKLDCIDYTYAIGYFQRLREMFRDSQGSLKVNQSRLMQETDKLISKEEEDIYVKEIDSLKEIINYLLSIKGIKHKDNNNDINETKNIINKLSNYSLNITNKIIKNYRSGIDTSEVTYNDLFKKLTLTEAIMEYTYEEITNKEQTINKLHSVSIESFKELDKEIMDLANSNKDLKDSLKYIFTCNNPYEALNIFNSIRGDLINIFMNIPVNKDKVLNKESYNNLLLKQKEKEDNLRNLKFKQDSFKLEDERLKEILKEGLISCPSCNHSFYNGYNKDKHDKIKSNIIKASEYIEKTILELEEINNKISEHQNYRTWIDNCINVFNTYPVLKPFYIDNIKNEMIFNNPSSLINELIFVEEDLNSLIKISKQEDKLKELLHLKSISEKNKEDDLNKLQLEVKNLRSKYENLQKDHRNSKSGIESIIVFNNSIKELKKYSTELEKKLSDLTTYNKHLFDNIKNEYIQNIISYLQGELNKRETIINKQNIQKSLIEHINIQIKEAEENMSRLKIAIKELSPTDGLIAKGLTRFINHFVKQMNSFISKVWKYPLELISILPNEEDSIDLDYKFAVKVNDSNIVSDIKLGSSAMKEIIDLAFRLVSMQYLHLNNYPIYLDEFSRSFDTEHRAAAYEVISNLLVSSEIPQIFLISHYEQSHGSLKNCDIVVLDESNIVIPQDSIYNKVAVIE